MHRKLTVRLGSILVKTARELDRLAPQVNPQLRLLMTHGSDDTVCPPEFSRAFFDRLPVQRKSYRVLEDALHEPFTGASRDTFFATLEGWVQRELFPSFAGDPDTAMKSAI